MADSAIEKALDLGNNSGNTNDHITQKLAMEVSLLTGGVAQGAWARAKECADKPVQNALAVGATTAVVGGIGYALKRLCMSRTEQWTELAMIAFGLYEGVHVVRVAAGAAGETWRSPSTYKQNKNLIADELGKPLFDLALYSAAGAGGFWKGGKDYELSRYYVDTPLELQATRRSTATHFPLLVEDKSSWCNLHIEQIRVQENPQLAQLYAKTTPAIVQIHQGIFGMPAPSTFAGTGFIVGDDLIATNNHVIRGRVVKAVRVKLNTGEMVDAKLVARDKASDLALLQVPPGSLTATPLELGSTAAVETNSPIYSIGHPFGVSRPVASSGLVYSKWGIKYRQSTHGLLDANPAIEDFGRRFTLDDKSFLKCIERPNEPAPIIRQEVIKSTLPGWHGGSGSPVLDASGKVLGVFHSRDTHSGAATAEHLKALIEAHKANQLPDTWLKVITHAEPLPVPKNPKAIDTINSAKVDIVHIKRFGPLRAATKNIADSL